MPASRHPYILGSGDSEFDRLAHQHEVWRDTTERLWDLAGFGPDQRLVDLACGPGFTSFELAERAGSGGHVLAVDNSDRFLGALDGWRKERRINNLSTRLADASDLGLPADSADGVFVRWLLCFLPDPSQVIQEAARVLAPGGRLVVMDYFHYLAIQLFPESSQFRHVFHKVYESFADSGGSLDVASGVPAFMAQAGLEVTHVESLGVVARPGEPVWQWVRAFQKNYLPQLVEQGYLSPFELQAFEDDWLAHEQHTESLFYSPPMLGVVGRKPG